ncbi:helix-turn-helix transcriptional regulator [Agaribacterium sp. ZY112]|uniref:AraC family transcriptional regulator n=1 Tax=Agaribacterium sp. ZY112 TaxID=3233574 RepID=UPI0035256CD0
MIELPDNVLHYTFFPLLSAQLLIVVLIYFVFEGKRLLRGFSFHIVFLAAYTLYLAGRFLQGYSHDAVFSYLLYSRVAVLLCLAIPCMVIATALQAGHRLKRFQYVTPFVLALLITAFYVFNVDVSHFNLLFSPSWSAWLSFDVSALLAERAVFLYIAVVVFLPCCYLLYSQISNERDTVALLFIAGSLLFALFQVGSAFINNGYWLYYIGSVLTAACWACAVYIDIRQSKGQAELLKEELQLAITRRNDIDMADVDELLVQLQLSSQGNLDLYKLKVRELLNRLTDSTIHAGADANSMLQRNASSMQAVNTSLNAEQLKQFARDEALELGAVLAQLPKSKSQLLVDKARSYIQNAYCEHINIGQMAESLAVSSSYLMRSFKKEQGLTINQYVTALRIEKAKAMLLQHSVTDTAFAVGFNNSNYFSSVFKKYTGLSPGDYQLAKRPD